MIGPNKYLVFFNGQKMEVTATTLLEAKEKGVTEFKVKSNQRHLVHAYLAEKDNGEVVFHSGDEL